MVPVSSTGSPTLLRGLFLSSGSLRVYAGCPACACPARHMSACRYAKMRLYEVLTDTAASLVEAARAAQPSSLEMVTAVGASLQCFHKVLAALHVVPTKHYSIHLSVFI